MSDRERSELGANLLPWDGVVTSLGSFLPPSTTSGSRSGVSRRGTERRRTGCRMEGLRSLHSLPHPNRFNLNDNSQGRKDRSHRLSATLSARLRRGVVGRGRDDTSDGSWHPTYLHHCPQLHVPSLTFGSIRTAPLGVVDRERRGTRLGWKELDPITLYNHYETRAGGEWGRSGSIIKKVMKGRWNRSAP